MTSGSSNIRFAWRGLASLAALAVFSGCGGSREPSAEDKLRQENCPAVQANKEFEETPYVGSADGGQLSFATIRANINAACAACHQAPAKTGGFTYYDAWKGAEVTLGGETKWLPGYFEVADKMRDYIMHPDLKKRMPPADRRGSDDAFLELGKQIDQWIQAGRPEGTFKPGTVTEAPKGRVKFPKAHVTSDLGDCVPNASIIGTDYGRDRAFETMTSLPKTLTETDMITLDPYELAKKGTVAYNVEYPLWADNADKGRWIHVPMKMIDGKVRKQSVEYDSTTRQFKIPENTRFYKTFYRAVKLPNNRIRMRRMETRLIVSRTPWDKSLFGTYQWDEAEQTATLVDAPYRDGTPWKDVLFDAVVDVKTQKVRPYAIPGRQRCIDCHRGSPTQNFVLGFQPLQINKRPLGAAGRIDPVEAHDLNQVNRFLSYGLLTGLRSVDELPTLETSGSAPPRNDYELRANGYTIGNCAHCHNPNGLAFTKENGIQLALGAGDLFSFNTQRRAFENNTYKLVHQNGDLDGSFIWRKVSDPPAQQGMFSQMPMHTPGSPDCRVLTVMGKWIRSFESVAAADEWIPNCKKENPFFWIDTDFTWVSAEKYTPRRADWKDPVEGMSQKYRDILLTPELEEAIKTEYAVGYWLRKSSACQFPTMDLPAEKRRPWMMLGSRPKRPFGEVYSTTPGAYFFRNTCLKCHGPKADGDSSLARGILNWSGGSVRVANLADGMFGRKGENLKTFELDGRDLSGNYLIWMAMEGTRVRFPPEVASFMGKHGGRMLNGIREKCLAQISSDKPSSPQFFDHEMFSKVCFMGNLQPGHPDLEFDPETNEPKHPDRVEEWLDRAAWNAGWAIYQFMKDSANGIARPNNDQCELVYPKH